MIAAISAIAEERIRRAQEQGDFDGLPGRGKPLDLASYTNIPEELRMAYTLLKNGGYLSRESGGDVSSRLQDLLPHQSKEQHHVKAIQKVQLIEARMRQRGKILDLERHERYYTDVVAKLCE